MFEPVRFGSLPTHRIEAVGVPSQPRVCRRLGRIESAFAEIPELRLDLPRYSWLSVTGARTDRYSLVLWLETSDEDKAAAIADRADLRRRNDAYEIGIPDDLLDAAVFRWEIVAPRDRPVAITGAHATVGVYGMRGSVKVSSGDGQISVLDGSGTTDVDATRGAHAVWAGERGTVRINADTGIYLKVTDRVFAGTLDASSAGLIHVWLPRGFAGGIEAVVPRDTAPVCHARIEHIAQQTEGDRSVFTYGTAPAQLRLLSAAGDIVFENSSDDDRAR